MTNAAPDWFTSSIDPVQNHAVSNAEPANENAGSSSAPPTWFTSSIDPITDHARQDLSQQPQGEDQTPIDGTDITRGMVSKIKDSTWGDIGSSLGAAIPQGLENTANLPQNLINIPVHHLLTGLMNVPEDQVPKYLVPTWKQFIDKMRTGDPMNAPDATYTGQLYQPKTLPGKAVNAVAQALVGNKAIGAPMSNKVAAMGGAGALGMSELAHAVVPGWEDVGGLLGGLATGGATSLAEQGLASAKGAVGKIKANLGLGAKETVAPGVNATPEQQAMIGKEILGEAHDPQYVKTMMGLDPNAKSPGVPFVPGSKPTLSQSLIQPDVEGNMGDPGVAAWQKGVELQPGNLERVNQRRADVAKAQNNAIASVAQEGDPAAVGKFFSAQLNDLESTAATENSAATGNVQQATENLGGHGNPIRYGAEVRQQLTNAAEASKEHYNGLWKSLEPYDAAPIDGSPVKDAVAKAAGSLDHLAGEKLTPQEAHIHQAIGKWGEIPEGHSAPAIPTFGTLRALNKTVNDAIQEVGKSIGFSSAPVVRLMAVKNAVKQTIEHNVDLASQDENVAVQSGQMPQAETIQAKLTRWRDEYLGAREGTSGGRSSQSSPRSAAGPAQAAPGAMGTAGAAGGGSGNVAGSESLSKAPSALTPEAAQTYKQYKAERTKHGETFESGPVGQALERGERAGTFNTTDALVTQKFFHQGKNAPDDIAAYMDAAKDKGAALQHLQDGAVAELRDPRHGAINPDGTINQAKYQAWVKRNSKAINALPELKDKLSTAASAQDALNETMGRNKAALDDFNNTKAAQFIKGDPIDAVGGAFRAKNAPQELSKLADQVKPDAAATAGLQRATAEYILREVRKAKDGDTTGLDLASPKKFRDFMDKHSKGLVKILGGQGKNTLDMVVADIRRSAINEQATKLAGRSDTAQLKLAADKIPGGSSLMSKLEMILENPGSLGAAGATVGTHIAGLPGGAVGGFVGAKVGGMLHALRQSHITTLDQLRIEAVLHPELARVLMSKVHATDIPVTLQKRAATLMLAGPVLTASTGAAHNQEKRK